MRMALNGLGNKSEEIMFVVVVVVVVNAYCPSKHLC